MTLRSLRGQLSPGADPIEWAVPGEDLAIRGHQTMPSQGGGDDHSVGGIAVEVGQRCGSNADVAGEGYLDETFGEQLFPPAVGVGWQRQPPFFLEHSDLPEGDRGHGGTPRVPGCADQIERCRTQPRLVGAPPIERLRVEENHSASPSDGASRVASHTSSIDQSMSSAAPLGERRWPCQR